MYPNMIHNKIYLNIIICNQNLIDLIKNTNKYTFNIVCEGNINHDFMCNYKTNNNDNDNKKKKKSFFFFENL